MKCVGKKHVVNITPAEKEGVRKTPEYGQVVEVLKAPMSVLVAEYIVIGITGHNAQIRVNRV